MNVTYTCPICSKHARCEFTSAAESLACPHCAQSITIPPGAVQEKAITRCLVCPSRDLYVRKDIPQRFGVGVVVLGIVGSSIAWAYHQPLWTFGILFATALVDFVLFFVVSNSLMCYRCHAQYRGVEEMEAHGAFNLETHERYRQMSARLSQPPAATSPRSS